MQHNNCKVILFLSSQWPWPRFEPRLSGPEFHCSTIELTLHSHFKFCFCPTLQDWQRGELVSFIENGRKMKVFLFDYGDTKIVDIKDVRRLPKRFGSLPKMAVPCKLVKLCPPTGCKTFSGKFEMLNFYNLIVQ